MKRLEENKEKLHDTALQTDFLDMVPKEQAPEAKTGQTGTSDLKTTVARDKNQQAAKRQPTE